MVKREGKRRKVKKKVQNPRGSRVQGLLGMLVLLTLNHLSSWSGDQGLPVGTETGKSGHTQIFVPGLRCTEVIPGSGPLRVPLPMSRPRDEPSVRVTPFGDSSNHEERVTGPIMNSVVGVVLK